MPIDYIIRPQQVYFVSKFEGIVTDEELLTSYKDFITNGDWTPKLNELVDLENADLSQLTTAGLEEIASYYQETLHAHQVVSIRTAVYAPNDLPYGMARMYAALAQQSPENVVVFRERTPAIDWLENKTSR